MNGEHTRVEGGGKGGGYGNSERKSGPGAKVGVSGEKSREKGWGSREVDGHGGRGEWAKQWLKLKMKWAKAMRVK